MLIYITAFLTTSFLALVLGIYVIYRRWHNDVNRSWFYLSLAVAYYCALFCLHVTSKSAETATLIARFLAISSVLIPPLFLKFTAIITGLNARKAKIVQASLLLSIPFFLIIPSELYFQASVQHPVYKYYVKAGSLHPLFVVYFYTNLVISFIFLVHGLIKKSHIKGLQYVLIATAVGFIGASSTFFTAYGNTRFDYFVFLIPLYPVITTIGIIRHQLMDIRIVIKRTIYYSLLALTVSIGYLLVTAMLYIFLKERIDILDSRVINVIGLIAIALFLKPIELILRRALDNFFFKGTLAEIAEQKDRLKSELERRERLKSVGVLAAGMAHEIKNPITVLKTFAEYIPKKKNDPDFMNKFSETVSRETGRIAGLVQHLLAFAKPSEPNRKAVDLSEIISDVLQLLSVDIIQKKIKVNFHPQPINVCVDRNQIKQALLNLIMNAIEAMKSTVGGEIFIQVEDRGKEVILLIKDNGPGIGKEDLNHIFDPFYTTKEEGSGLGLAVTYSIIEKNQGKITASSTEGSGTEFVIKFTNQ